MVLVDPDSDPDPQHWFLGINSSLLRLEFLSGFYSQFSVLQNAFMNRLKFSCVADFLKDYKNQE